MKTYFIHDNGNRPFKVEIDSENKAALIYKLTDYQYDEIYEEEPSIYFYEEIFIGKSNRCAMTNFSRGYGHEFDGNTILLKIKDSQLDYLYIGPSIFKFTALDVIDKYLSHVGNSDVPYPVARDNQSNLYLLEESVILLSTKIQPGRAYSWYYKNNVIGKSYFVSDLPPSRENFEILSNNAHEIYNISFNVNPSERYEILLDLDENINNKMWLIEGGDSWENYIVKCLDINAWVQLHSQFAIQKNIQVLEKTIIEKRSY